jgi:hypothetical protein
MFHKQPTRGPASGHALRSLRRLGLAALLGIAVSTGGVPAQADDNDDMPDTKFFRSILKSLGLRRDEAGIEYRERSPLVLPPGKELRPPSASENARTAAWPNDPDIKRERERKAQSRKPVVYNEDGDVGARPALPSELNVPNARPRSRDSGGPAISAEASAAPSSPKELGAKSIFSSWWSPKEEYSTFAGEPQRGNLTEPPPGYRTPSPHQPYGVGKEKWRPGSQGRHEDVK